MTFQYDKQADALAIDLGDPDAPSMRTVQIDPGTLVDLDARGQLISIEVIHPARHWPLDQILEQYAIDPEDEAVLRSLWAEGTPYPFESTERELLPV